MRRSAVVVLMLALFVAWRVWADGAANWTSGKSKSSSEFKLEKENKRPKGITTDGSFVWTVDAKTRSVYVYTTDGQLDGSWKIDPENKAPAGITIDPTGASQSVWNVDHKSDQIFEYADAISRRMGSQSADMVFDLDNANRNPQGIADPPSQLDSRSTSVSRSNANTPLSHPFRPTSVAEMDPAAPDKKRMFETAVRSIPEENLDQGARTEDDFMDSGRTDRSMAQKVRRLRWTTDVDSIFADWPNLIAAVDRI